MALVDHKPTTAEVPQLTKKQLKEACKDTFIQTKVKLRSRWAAPIKYKVLQTFQLSDKDRKHVAKTMIKAVTPTIAREIAHKEALWSYRDISLVKDFECGVLQFKGLAVCLFYKRQCNEIEPVATDPVPIGALEDEVDLYARLDLFSKSPRELHSSVREELLSLSMEVEELKHELAVTRAALEQKEKSIRLQTAKSQQSLPKKRRK